MNIDLHGQDVLESGTVKGTHIRLNEMQQHNCPIDFQIRWLDFKIYRCHWPSH